MEVVMRIGSFIIAALGALAAGAYYYESHRRFEREEKETPTPPRKPWSMSENGMDEELDESFPASDPPSWSSGGLH
jgi:hypothetical protein